MVQSAHQDVPASMREGVAGFFRVVGLSEAVLRLSGESVQSVNTRAGLAKALDIIRSQNPSLQDTVLRLSLSTSTPEKAARAFKVIQIVCDRGPDVGYFRSKRVFVAGRNMAPCTWISGESTVLENERSVWDCVSKICVANQTDVKAIKSPSQLAMLARRSLKILKGSAHKAAEALAAIPRIFAIDADSAAIAYAYAPRERGAIPVVVVNTTVKAVWRASATTRVRPVSPRPWHHDPAIATIMLDRAQMLIARCAPRQITAPEGSDWVQAVLIETIEGFDTYIQKQNGTIDLVEIVGRGSWVTLGIESAVRLSSIFGQPVTARSASWLSLGEVLDIDQSGNFVVLNDLLDSGIITVSEAKRYSFRVQAAIERSRDAAILAFYANLCPAVSRLARLIMPTKSWDAASNRKHPLSCRDLDVALAAATHRNTMAMVRAVENSSTRSLVMAAALCGPWQVASDALAAGRPSVRALSLYTSALIGRPLSPAGLISLATWPTPVSYGLKSYETCLSQYKDAALLAASLWAAQPSRPAMTTAELLSLSDGLKLFGFVEPSVAGPYDRTWVDPSITTAYSESLRRMRSDVPGSAILDDAVYSMVHFLDTSLCALGLAHDAFEAVRKAILVPSDRLAQGLERMAMKWHRSVVDARRERRALVQQLIEEQALEDGAGAVEEHLKCFPNPINTKVFVGDVVVQALLTAEEIESEGRGMANCIAKYCEEARVGDLLIFRMTSPFGRTNLGLVVTGNEFAYQIHTYKHFGSQHHEVDAPPPRGHTDAAYWLISSLMKRDGGCGGRNWRENYFEVRRSHARSIASKTSEQTLSPERQRQLTELSFKHLGCLLGKNERKLQLADFQKWADRLVTEG